MSIFSGTDISFIISGDDLFPKCSDHIADEELSFNSSMLELRNAAKSLHRGEIASRYDIYFVTNVKPRFGHVTPLNYKDHESVSKL